MIEEKRELFSKKISTFSEKRPTCSKKRPICIQLVRVPLFRHRIHFECIQMGLFLEHVGLFSENVEIFLENNSLFFSITLPWTIPGEFFQRLLRGSTLLRDCYFFFRKGNTHTWRDTLIFDMSHSYDTRMIDSRSWHICITYDTHMIDSGSWHICITYDTRMIDSRSWHICITCGILLFSICTNPLLISICTNPLCHERESIICVS